MRSASTLATTKFSPGLDKYMNLQLISKQHRMTVAMRCFQLAVFSSFVSIVLAHGDHSHEQVPLAADADWATRHMAGK